MSPEVGKQSYTDHKGKPTLHLSRARDRWYRSSLGLQGPPEERGCVRQTAQAPEGYGVALRGDSDSGARALGSEAQLFYCQCVTPDPVLNALGLFHL